MKLKRKLIRNNIGYKRIPCFDKIRRNELRIVFDSARACLCGTRQNDVSIFFYQDRRIYGVLGIGVSLDSVVGTYCGVLQTDVETILTLNINGTYLLIQTYKEEQNEQEKLRGTFQVLDGNILMFIHPSSGDNIFYKVRDDNNIILIDSFGNEPKKADRKNY